MTRSQSNYSLKNDNVDSHMAINGSGNLIKNSFSSTNLASAAKITNEFKVLLQCFTVHFLYLTTYCFFTVQRSILEENST